MSDIVERLRVDNLLGLPGAGIIGACREAADEIESLRQQLAEKDAEIARLKASWQSVAIEDMAKQLAASQAREVRLREAMEDMLSEWIYISVGWDRVQNKTQEALAMPQDTSALEAMIAKAGEVMRERCVGMMPDLTVADLAHVRRAIRALPGVTLEDLK